MSRMHYATVKWVRGDDYEGWALQFERDDGGAETRRVQGRSEASREELVTGITEALRGDYLDGKITVLRNGGVAETIVAERGIAS